VRYLIDEFSMDDLRQKIISYLGTNEEESLVFFDSISLLAKKEGEQVYNILINVLTQMEFSPEDAKKKWNRIVDHKLKLETKLGHSISLMTAVCSYFSDVEKIINTPIIIELKKLEETKKKSHTDVLTGLSNRRYFDDALQGEMNRVLRYEGCFSIFFIDLDNFKKFNDTYGHHAGDITLKVVAEIIQNMKRTEDIVCRYGGEEFIMILPETEKMNALVIAERIRKKVEETVIEFEDKTFNITLSGGISSCPADGKEPQELLKAADVRLYQAKESGRNRICIHDFE
jgi:diguanylate cyclase (GGDEF)-like protein